jgi:hypothetical protein
MSRILVTGMSGTGKSSALAELGRRGYRVVDTDDSGWCEWVDSSEDGRGERLWLEDHSSTIRYESHGGFALQRADAVVSIAGS